MADVGTAWDQRHRSASPWDSGRPCRELERVLQEYAINACRALELGCGNGTNAVVLARRGFEVTAVDISGEALERGRAAARAAGAEVRFLKGDVLQLPDLGAPFGFVFDRGLYQHARATDRAGFERVLERVTAPGSLYLAIVPSAHDSAVRRVPRALRDYEMCLDLERSFRLLQLREIEFDPVVLEGRELRPLMWSALYRRT